MKWAESVLHDYNYVAEILFIVSTDIAVQQQQGLFSAMALVAQHMLTFVADSECHCLVTKVKLQQLRSCDWP